MTTRIPQVAPRILDLLRGTDTCAVSNAIETLAVRMRNEGYVHRGLHCMFPELPPVAGYAITGRMRASAPPIAGLCYYQRMDWWQYVASISGPKIIVVEDVDQNPGIGALFGEIHAQIGKALGCVGYLTNGSVRDLNAVRALEFQCFAKGSVVSHSYAHLIEFGMPVEIGGLNISPGDLLHGDNNGIHSIPVAVADQLPAALAEISAHEAELIALCRGGEFSLAKLEEAVRKSAQWSPRPGFH